jgi:hypothetical protein
MYEHVPPRNHDEKNSDGTRGVRGVTLALHIGCRGLSWVAASSKWPTSRIFNISKPPNPSPHSRSGLAETDRGWSYRGLWSGNGDSTNQSMLQP